MNKSDPNGHLAAESYHNDEDASKYASEPDGVQVAEATIPGNPVVGPVGLEPLVPGHKGRVKSLEALINWAGGRLATTATILGAVVTININSISSLHNDNIRSDEEDSQNIGPVIGEDGVFTPPGDPTENTEPIVGQDEENTRRAYEADKAGDTARARASSSEGRSRRGQAMDFLGDLADVIGTIGEYWGG